MLYLYAMQYLIASAGDASIYFRRLFSRIINTKKTTGDLNGFHYLLYYPPSEGNREK